MATNVKVTQDWNNDGFLRISDAETIGRYLELKQCQYNIPAGKYGVFFAFSKDQFDMGYKDLVKRGLIKEGDRVSNFGQGAFGLKEGMKRWMDEAHAIDEQIAAECDPYEVYLEEYNNFECCIDYDGDERAVEEVIRLFGVERATKALYRRRFRKCGEIDAIAARMKN